MGRGAYLRAYDKATGADAGQVFMPGAADGIADDLHAERLAVHRRCSQRVPGFAGELLVYKLGS
jgi:hypothetical protein